MREAGILLAISSLPSREGIGTLGAGAYAFVDYLKASGVKVWQVLPLTPVREGNSPYSSVAAFALNPLYIDLYDLVKEGLLREEEIAFEPSERVDYPAVSREKERLLRLAFSRFDSKGADFVAFERENEYRDYAVFATLLAHFEGKDFRDWTDGYDVYDEARTTRFIEAHGEEYLYRTFTQYIFLRQWQRLKAYANAAGVKLFGDMPIYLAMNSAEVYMHPEMFMLGEDRRPRLIAGVPPDYFNEEGQLWGNPLYDWEAMKETGYAWWRARIKKELALFDYLRIDHFRGLDRFYAVEADATDAKHGKWLAGPGAALFDGMTDEPIIAEDLGYIDESLRAMLDKVGFPGMKVYEFGLDGDPWNEHKPANYKENVVAYSGTHDNMPFCGYLGSLTEAQYGVAAKDILVQALVLGAPISDLAAVENLPSETRELLDDIAADYPVDDNEKKTELQKRVDAVEREEGRTYLPLPAEALTRKAIETLFLSKARLAVVPMQDLLALGEESRMNTPALVSEENWAWRLAEDYARKAPAEEMRAVLLAAERA